MTSPFGYSGKTLVTKLGYKKNDTVFVCNEPHWFRQELLRSDIIVFSTLPSTHGQVFVARQQDLHNLLNEIELNDLQQDLWISWPKQTLRDIVLPHNWVDIKVAVINKIWSGLRFARSQS